MSGIEIFTVWRRNLPHWQAPGRVDFLTWRAVTGMILSGDERTIALNAIRHWEGKRWRIYAGVIMPDHVHLLVQPLPLEDNPTICHELGTILHSVKSYSAHQINKYRHRSGPVWQDERYDRIIRNETELLEKWQYIRENPVKNGLAITTEAYPWFFQADLHRPEVGATE